MHGGRTLGVAALLLFAAAAPRPPRGYTVRTTVALAPDSIGGSRRGRIELLEDARIRPDMREAVAAAYGGDPCAVDVSSERRPDLALRDLCAAPKRVPLRPAILRVVDTAGHVVWSERQERPLAELRAVQLYGDGRQTFLITVDLSYGVGSYRGFTTRLAEIRDGRVVWLSARDASPRDRAGASLVAPAGEIHLTISGKEGWRIVPRRDGRGKDILLVTCRPDHDAKSGDGLPVFMDTYQRFTVSDGRWVRHARREPGCFEGGPDSTDFPPHTKFP